MRCYASFVNVLLVITGVMLGSSKLWLATNGEMLWVPPHYTDAWRWLWMWKDSYRSLQPQTLGRIVHDLSNQGAYSTIAEAFFVVSWLHPISGMSNVIIHDALCNYTLVRSENVFNMRFRLSLQNKATIRVRWGRQLHLVKHPKPCVLDILPFLYILLEQR